MDVCVSSWAGCAEHAGAGKAGANANSQREDGSVQRLASIALDVRARSEGRGENIFVVRDGKIHTPPLGASVLPGITRDSILTLAREADIPVVETIIPRELLYIADEVFFSGTAAEITPIRSIDRITIGNGRRGPIAEQLQKEFFGVINGTKKDAYGWLSHVHAAANA